MEWKVYAVCWQGELADEPAFTADNENAAYDYAAQHANSDGFPFGLEVIDPADEWTPCIPASVEWPAPPTSAELGYADDDAAFRAERAQ